MTLHQDTAAFTQTERSLMAQALRRDALHTREIVRNHDVEARTALPLEYREIRLLEADTLWALADDVEWGHRR